MRRFFHPSMRKLNRWADGEDISIGSHLATCEYCANRMEPLLEDFDESIRAALIQLLPVPDRLPERLRSGIDDRLANQRELMLIGEFFGLPLQTARVFSSNDQGDD